MNKIFKQKAFTLAEVLAVLVILGVVATMTIPSTVRRTAETANRTKILKAMAAWEDFVPQFLLENGIQDEVQAGEVYKNAPVDDCSIVTKYFKYETQLGIIKNKKGDYIADCAILTSDGIAYAFDVRELDDKVDGNPSKIKEGLLGYVCFTEKNKQTGEYQCKDFRIKETGETYDHFIFYFHYSPEKNALYINDPSNTPWYNWKGTDWCKEHPFGHGCWTGLKEFDNNALLPWMYTKINNSKDK